MRGGPRCSGFGHTIATNRILLEFAGLSTSKNGALAYRRIEKQATNSPFNMISILLRSITRERYGSRREESFCTGRSAGARRQSIGAERARELARIKCIFIKSTMTYISDPSVHRCSARLLPCAINVLSLSCVEVSCMILLHVGAVPTNQRSSAEPT